MKKIVILGSTGSIGTNTLDIVSKFPGKFQVIGMTAGTNVESWKSRCGPLARLWSRCPMKPQPNSFVSGAKGFQPRS